MVRRVTGPAVLAPVSTGCASDAPVRDTVSRALARVYYPYRRTLDSRTCLARVVRELRDATRAKSSRPLQHEEALLRSASNRVLIVIMFEDAVLQPCGDDFFRLRLVQSRHAQFRNSPSRSVLGLWLAG